MSKSSVAPSRPPDKGLPQASLRADPPCIDLAERFGRRYRVEYEESYFAQYGPRARVNDPWLKIIPCQRGHIYPFGPSTLAATTSTRGPTARKLAALDFATIHQDGDDGVTILFPMDRMPEVAELMKPRRRRAAPTQAQLEALAAGRRPFTQKPVDKSVPEPRPCVQTTLCDSEAVLAGAQDAAGDGDGRAEQ